MEHAPVRAYDRLLAAAAEQMVSLPPRPNLARAAEDAGVCMEEAAAIFADDHALGVEVIQQQLVSLTDYIGRRTAAADCDDVLAQLREMTQAYVDWCFSNDVGSRLLSSPNAMELASEHEVARFSTAIYALAESMMQRAQDTGRLPPDLDVANTLLTVRALTLGIAALHAMDHARLWGNPKDPEAALRRTIDAYFALIVGKQKVAV